MILSSPRSCSVYNFSSQTIELRQFVFISVSCDTLITLNRYWLKYPPSILKRSHYRLVESLLSLDFEAVIRISGSIICAVTTGTLARR